MEPEGARLPLARLPEKGICVGYSATVTGYVCNLDTYETVPYK